MPDRNIPSIPSLIGRGRFIAAGLCVLVVAGCMVGPDYQKPVIATSPTFRGGDAAPTSESTADLGWWQVYSDPALQDLIRTALNSNLDLRIAATRIEQAR